MKKTERPQITSTDRGQRYTHPAYGTISVSRIQCGGRTLFGSDLDHQSYVAITVNRAAVERDLHRDFVFPKEELIEFAMSESQWARFVSGAGQSFCTEVTLDRCTEGGEYKMVPSIERAEESRKDQFDQEFQQKLLKALEGFNKSVEDLKELSDGKSVSKVKLKEVVKGLQIQLSNLPSNLNFAVEQFKEVTEKNVDEAKAEVQAYIVAAAQRAGLPSTEVPHLPAPTSPETPTLP